MNVAEWQKRLENNFPFKGNLTSVDKLEKEYGVYLNNTFHGRSVLIDSFQVYFIETLNCVIDWVTKKGWPDNCEYYPATFMFYVTMFKSFRACESLLRSGYPLDGYALLRDLKDRSILLAGIAHNIVSYPKTQGFDGSFPISKDNMDRIRKLRKKAEFSVRNKIIGKESALPNHIQNELHNWEQLFHEEVHGSRFSSTCDIEDLLKKGQVAIGPIPKENPIAMYMNRSNEISWLLLRLLSYLQPVKNAFGEEWRVKGLILDDSFRHSEQQLCQMGKKIADAFIFFVDTKFDFLKPFNYFEANGMG